jgi:hypothetical protein
MAARRALRASGEPARPGSRAGARRRRTADEASGDDMYWRQLRGEAAQ